MLFDTHSSADTASQTNVRSARGAQRKWRGRVVHMSWPSRSVVTHGLRGGLDLYHRALTLSWPAFFGLLATLFLLVDAAFAGLYLCGTAPIANQSPPGFIGAFFFS